MSTSPPLPQIKDGSITHEFVVLIIVASVFTTLSSISVALRFLSRNVAKSTGVDDWTALAALLFAYGYLITVVLIATVGHAGYPPASYGRQQLETYLKIQLAIKMNYNTSIGLSRAAVLLLYRRLFAVQSFKCWNSAFFVLVGANWFLTILVCIFSSNPVAAQWKFWLPHTSINGRQFWMASGIANVIIDFGILLLPQMQIWRLHLSTKRKVLLSLMFLVGFFTSLTTIARVVAIKTVSMTSTTNTDLQPRIWEVIEVNMSIICGCGPTLPKLFQHWQQTSFWDSFSSSFRLSNRLRSSSSIQKSDSVPHVTYLPDSSDEYRHSIGEKTKYPVLVQTDIEIVHVDRVEGECNTPTYKW